MAGSLKTRVGRFKRMIVRLKNAFVNGNMLVAGARLSKISFAA